MIYLLKYYCIVNLKILSLISSPLAIEEQRGNEFHARVLAAIDSNYIAPEKKHIDQESLNQYQSLPEKFESAYLYPISEFGYAAPVSAAPSNSIAIISFDDAITCDDYWSAGMYTKANILMQCYNTPNIIGVICAFNTPGGESSAIEIMADAIKMRNKPVVAFVKQLCASAGYGIASACEEIIAKSKMSQVGSIGTMMSFYDWPAYLKSKGLPVYSLYAPESNEKNFAWREATAEPRNFKPYYDYLTIYNNHFKELITENRGDKILATDPVWNGQVYFGEDAVKHHLIDSINDLNFAAQRVEELYNSNYKSKTIYYV